MLHACTGGVSGLLLTSSMLSEGDHVSVCPNTNITFTCTATSIFALVWYAKPLLNEQNTQSLSIRRDPGFSFVVEDTFTMTVESIENVTASGDQGDLTSTLNMVVNDRIPNRTNVTCKTPSKIASLIILRKGAYYYYLMYCSCT